MRYTVLRLMLFFGCLIVFYLVSLAVHLPGLAILILAAVSSLALSLVILRGPREAMSARLYDRINTTMPPAPSAESDEAVEDAADEARRRGPA
jgi:hypothetical protein